MENELILAGDRIGEEQILSANLYMAQSIDGKELQIDTLDARLDLGGYRGSFLAPGDGDRLQTVDGTTLTCLPMIRVLVNDPAQYHYGVPVLLNRGSRLIGKYYMSKLTRVGPTQYRISCVSAIGVLDKSQHFGGVYRAVNVPDILSEIIAGVIPYTVGPEYSKVKVYGWLPVGTRRENLHQVLFAIGAAVSQDDKGDPLFTPFRSNAYTPIPEDRVFMGGDVKYPEDITKVSVCEHSFAITNGDKIETLFDGPIIAEEVVTPLGAKETGGIVIFREPCDKNSLTATGCSILERGVNYAVLSPSAAAKLEGKPYTHTIRQVNYPPESAGKSSASQENRITVDDATLVSYANAENVAKRVYSYYNSAKTVTADIVVEDERPGTAVELEDPFGDPTRGLIKSMDVNLSHLFRASTEIVSGYTPEKPGNYYTNVVVLTEDGNWTVPPEAKDKIRVALIGGGEGGWSGLPGKASRSGGSYGGNSYRGYGHGRPGEGGKPGTPGRGGKVHVISLAVKPGDTFPVTIGKGGKGASTSSGESIQGSLGGATCFGSHSSALGSYTSGYSEDSSGEVYAQQGEAGVAGGSGSGWSGEGDPARSSNNLVQGSTVVGPDGTSYGPGSNSSHHYESHSAGGRHHNAGYGGGCGGGAAVGRSGNPGTTNGSAYASSYQVTATGAPGGSGATPIKPPSHQGSYGRGGDGGHGGGGGGGGSWSEINWTETDKLKPPSDRTVHPAPSAPGGLGGEGGDGEDGCVIIYY